MNEKDLEKLMLFNDNLLENDFEACIKLVEDNYVDGFESLFILGTLKDKTVFFSDEEEQQLVDKLVSKGAFLDENERNKCLQISARYCKVNFLEAILKSNPKRGLSGSYKLLDFPINEAKEAENVSKEEKEKAIELLMNNNASGIKRVTIEYKGMTSSVY